MPCVRRPVLMAFSLPALVLLAASWILSLFGRPQSCGCDRGQARGLPGVKTDVGGITVQWFEAAPAPLTGTGPDPAVLREWEQQFSPSTFELFGFSFSRSPRFIIAGSEMPQGRSRFLGYTKAFRAPYWFGLEVCGMLVMAAAQLRRRGQGNGTTMNRSLVWFAACLVYLGSCFLTGGVGLVWWSVLRHYSGRGLALLWAAVLYGTFTSMVCLGAMQVIGACWASGKAHRGLLLTTGALWGAASAGIVLGFSIVDLGGIKEGLLPAVCLGLAAATYAIHCVWLPTKVKKSRKGSA